MERLPSRLSRSLDVLAGLGGADTFSFFAGAGTDLIQDFNGAEGDRIRFEGAHYRRDIGLRDKVSWQ